VKDINKGTAAAAGSPSISVSPGPPHEIDSLAGDHDTFYTPTLEPHIPFSFTTESYASTTVPLPVLSNNRSLPNGGVPLLDRPPRPGSSASLPRSGATSPSFRSDSVTPTPAATASPVPSPTRVRPTASSTAGTPATAAREVGPTLPEQPQAGATRQQPQESVGPPAPPPARGGDTKDLTLSPAMSLVGRVLQEQGLGRHIDEDFIAAAAVEMQEAMNMTAEEFNAAAQQLLMAEKSGDFRWIEWCNFGDE